MDTMSTNHQQEPGHHGSEFIPTNQPPGAVTNTQNMPTMLSPHQAESYGYGAESTFASAEYYRSNRLTRKELLERASELPYHRLSHVNPRARWFTPVLEGLLIAGIYFVLLLIVSFALLAFAVMLRVPYDYLTDLQRIYANVFKTPLVFIALLITIIPVIPAIFIARLITNFKPLGLIHSIAGRMRWSYLSVFLGFGFLIFGLYYVGNLVLAGSLTTQNSVHPLNSGMFWLYIVLILLIVPFQCYAEELLFRGYLMQTVGRWLKNPVWAIIIPAPIFMVLHGYGLWGLLSVLTMALIAGFLCWYTGGLEAGIGLHIANNVSIFIFGLLGLADPFDANREAQALDFVQALILQLAFAGLVCMYTYRQKRKAALNQGQDAAAASSAEGASMSVEASASSSDAPATAAPASGAAHAATQPGMSVKNAAASPAADTSASAPQGSQAPVQSQPVQPVQPAASVAVNAKPAQDNASVKSASSAAPASPQTAEEHRASERNIAEKPAAQAPAAKPMEGVRKSEQNDTSAKASAPAQPERSVPANKPAPIGKPAPAKESVPTHESAQSQKPAQTAKPAQAHKSDQPQKPVHTNESAQAERPTAANTAARATGKEAPAADKPAQSAQARTIADELKPAVVAPAAAEKAPSGIDLDAAQKAARASAQKTQQGSNRADSSVRASGAQGSASNAAAPQKEAASASAAQADDTKNPSSKNYAPDTSTMSIPVQNALSAYERAKAQALAQQKEAAQQKESGQGTSAAKNAAADGSAAVSQTSRAQQEASQNTSEVPWATAPIPKISPEAAQSHKQGSTDASPWTSAFPVIPKPKK